MESFKFAVVGGRPSGCYLLLRKGVVIYVGKSENLFQRIAHHWNQRERLKRGMQLTANTIAADKVVEFDEVKLIPLAMHELNREELRLIQVYQPEHNVLLNRQQIAPGLEKSSAFKELLTKKRQPLKIRRPTARSMRTAELNV